MRDYTNKTVFLGIDVHKKSYSVTAVCEGEIVKTDKLKACPETLVNYCKRFLPAKIISGYEAGFCGFYLHRFLIKHGIENMVIHPASIEIGSRDRVKTDKRDSLKIATQMSAGRLHSIYIPSLDQEHSRLITRSRAFLIEKRTRVACQIKCLLNLFDLIAWDDSKKMSARRIQEFLALECNPDLKFSLELLCKEWLERTKDIKIVDQHLKNQHHDLLSVYMSIPGFGPLSSNILINELGDLSQFSSEGRLFSYTGLTPSQYSSGKAIRLGHISHQGKPYLRKILVQAAWIAIRHDDQLAGYHEKLSMRTGSKRAIVAVARKLIGIARACIRDKVLYQTKNDNLVNVTTGELLPISGS